MNVFKDYEQAKRRFPKCLIGSGADDFTAIEAEAQHFGEPPMAILRGLVRTELDLIEEGQEAAEYYTKREVQTVRNYLSRLGR